MASLTMRSIYLVFMARMEALWNWMRCPWSILCSATADLQEPHGVTSHKTPILLSHRCENLKSYIPFFIVTAMVSSGMLRHVALVRFLQEPHGVTSQKTQFFIVTTMKTSNLTYCRDCLSLITTLCYLLHKYEVINLKKMHCLPFC
jgi:hypothetical protein